MNVQENKELWKHLAGISKEVTVLSTMMKEIVVPGIKKSGIKWDENDKLDLKGTVKAVKEIANQFDGLRVEQINIKNDHENLKIYVTDRLKKRRKIMLDNILGFISNDLIGGLLNLIPPQLQGVAIILSIVASIFFGRKQIFIRIVMRFFPEMFVRLMSAMGASCNAFFEEKIIDGIAAFNNELRK